MSSDPPGGPLERLPPQAITAPERRPPAIYQDFDAFLGAVLRSLVASGRASSPVRLLALAQTLGRSAVGRALTGRLEAASPSTRVGVKAAAAALAVLGRSLGPWPLGAAAAAAGIGYLATVRRVT